MSQTNTSYNEIIEYVRQTLDNKTRLNGRTLYDHVINVFNSLKSQNIKDEDTLVLALTHHMSVDQLKQNPNLFSNQNIELLEEFIDFKSREFKFSEAKELSKSNIFESIFKLLNNKFVLLVRIADKTEDIKTAYALPKETREHTAKRAMYLYAPLAKLTGLRRYASILQEEAFRILDPRNYYLTQKYIEEVSVKKGESLKEVVELITLLLNENNIDHQIQYRIKSNFSTYMKLKNKLDGQLIESVKDFKVIEDTFAIRVLVESVEDCYKTEDLIKGLFEIHNESRDDYIANPKPSGYKSLHMVIEGESDMLVEIQIRTYEMHQFNEYGEASHIFYKFKDINLKKYVEMDPNWLENIDFLNSRKEGGMNINTSEIFVFTPKDQIFRLPNGSGPLDFAYAVHVDIGNSYKGALVNERMVNLDYKLKDGDKIKIVTSPSETVNLDWLKKVKSVRAKREIKKALNKKLF